MDSQSVEVKINRIKDRFGESVQYLQLAGRLALFKGRLDTAISTYGRVTRLDPGNWDARLELAVSYAVRAECEKRPLDYEYAMEQMLALGETHRTPELEFDLALIFDQVPLPQASIIQWDKVLKEEPSLEWLREARHRRFVRRSKLKEWNTRFEELTSTPGSYLVYANQVGASLELVPTHALEDWLPKYLTDELAHTALDHLASVLRTNHGDEWLWDLLHTRAGWTSRTAFQELASAIRENNRGNHIHAAIHARNAQHVFEQFRNIAGSLRARLERVYSLDRQWREKECLDQMPGLRQQSETLHYRWITGQAWLEEIACQTETRHAEVIRDRERAYEWISKIGYESLRLRSASFLTEGEVSADRRLRIWAYGYSGLQSFWEEPMALNRGYTFYYTLASSAQGVGNTRAALILLSEGVRTLEGTPYRQLLALALSYQAAWEFSKGLVNQAVTTFTRLDGIFKHLDERETRKFRRMAEVARAEVDLKLGRPQSALERLEHVIEGLRFPYLSLSPTERRRLLPVLGEAFLKMGRLGRATKIYLLLVSENAQSLKTIRERDQRDNFHREIGPAWKGLTETYLERHDWQRALYSWEAFRGGRLQDPYPKPIRPPAGVALLTFAFLPKGLSAWLTEDTGIEQRWLDASSVEQSSKEFAVLAADKNSPLSLVTGLARQLYSELIKPFEEHLGHHRLLVIDADGALAGIPWAALEDSKGQVLIEQIAFAQVIGWTEVSRNLEGSAVDMSRVFILANPTLSASLSRDFPSLPDAQREAEWLYRMLPRSVFRKLHDATQETITEFLPTSTLFHFAGHGVSNGGFGALLLDTNSGLSEELTAAQIAKLKLPNLRLVVLAACSSGIGEGDGVVNLDSLVRSFLEAGATRVVAARWDVNSLETASSMTWFYKSLFNGKGPAAALREAVSLVRKQSGTAHPYYWAGFQVFGAP